MMKLYEFKALNKSNGSHWFDTDTMRFFKTRISNWDVISGLFITSESGPFGQGPRKFTLRKADFETGKVETIGEFQQYSSLRSAKTAMRNHQQKGA